MFTEEINKLVQLEVNKGIENFKRDYINTQFEKNKLYAYLGKELVNLLKKYKAYIAGGTITSLFCNRDINDVDIYFRDEESAIGFISELWEDRNHVASHTKKATQIIIGDINIQVIHFKYFVDPEDIFKTFDFTSCMGCYDFSKEAFVLHSDFLKHNSQRILKFNSETAFPIVSMLRVQKYENRGYKISKPEFIRIILTCMNLDINTYEELKEQMGGMYGINYDKLFEDMDEEEFSLEVAIDKITDMVLDEDYFKKPVEIEFDNLDEILDTISKKPVKFMEINGSYYKIGYDGFLKEIKHKPENREELDVEKYFDENKFYKFVKKDNDTYRSFYRNEFTYELNKEVAASNQGWNNGRLYFKEKHALHNASYSNDNGVVLEVKINPDDLVMADEGDIQARKCFVIREVPKEEYSQWSKDEKKEGDIPFA